MMTLIATIQMLAVSTTRAQPVDWRQQQFQSMHQHFSTTDPLIYVRLAIGFAAVVAIFVVVKILAYVQQQQKESVKAQPYSLFMNVQAQLGLPLLDRWRLWRMARVLRLPHPAAMLISPAFFDQAIERYSPSASRRAGLLAIRGKLFCKTASQSSVNGPYTE